MGNLKDGWLITAAADRRENRYLSIIRNDVLVKGKIPIDSHQHGGQCRRQTRNLAQKLFFELLNGGAGRKNHSRAVNPSDFFQVCKK